MRGRQYVTNVRRYPPDVPLALMDIAIGLLHILSSPRRRSSPSFAVARELLPLPVWGVVFLALGVALLIATYTLHVGGTSTAIGVIRTLGPALFVMWALMYLLAALHDERAAYLGIPSYLYLAYRHHFAPAAPVR